VVHRHGRIDYLFNSAGVNVVGEFQHLRVEDWQQIVNVNLWGVVYGCQAVYPHMLRQKRGHIVNIASGLGLTPAPRNSAYSASKFAIVGLSESLRIEAVDFGVQVSVVCPGWIRTPMLEEGPVAGPRPADGESGLRIADVAAHTPFPLADANHSALRILQGVRRGKALIVFPLYVQSFVLLYRLFRPISDWWNRYEIRSFRRLCQRTAEAFLDPTSGNGAP
jgi:short-subunit dehydrogenase